MGFAKADWVSHASGSPTLDLTTTVHGRIYHYLGTMVPPSDLFPSSLSVYVHDGDFVTQGKKGALTRLI